MFRLAPFAMLLICSVPAAFGAADPLAVYYSFDTPAPPAMFHEMQSELGRILAPTGVSVSWRPVEAPRDRGVDFPAIVLFRFHGRCTLDGSIDTETDPGGSALAESEAVAGHISPFANVDCDRVRAFLAPALRSVLPPEKDAILGRALARISAHEIYHMLSGVSEHDDHGLFQSALSRRDLTASVFSFAAPETRWLVAWQQKQIPEESPVQPEQSPTLPDASSTAVDSTAFAGR